MTELWQKRPIQVKAWRYTDPNERNNLPRWIVDALNAWPSIGGLCFNDRGHIDIATIDTSKQQSDISIAKAFIGDWVIKGIQGELYPCKHDIFLATYEPAPLVTPKEESCLPKV